MQSLTFDVMIICIRNHLQCIGRCYDFKAIGRWLSVHRRLSRHARDVCDFQITTLPPSFFHSLAAYLYLEALQKTKHFVRGVSHLGIVPVNCKKCGVRRSIKQNILRINGSNPVFYVGEECCVLPMKRRILQRFSGMKLLELLFECNAPVVDHITGTWTRNRYTQSFYDSTPVGV